MKVLHWFLGICFLVSISVCQNVQADNPIPAGLQSTIENVKRMKHSGTSRKDIATYVTKTVTKPDNIFKSQFPKNK